MKQRPVTRSQCYAARAINMGRVQAAEGYIALGMYGKGNDELEQIAPEVRHLPEVLALRAAIYRGTGRWELLVTVTARLVEVEPEESGWFIDLAYATRRASSIIAACIILRRAEVLHGDDPNIQFNLACYEAQLGHLDEARRCLARAIKLEPKFRELALDDPDLEPVW